MRDATMLDRILALHAAGLPIPPISGGDGKADAETPPPAPDLGKLVQDAIAKAGDPNAAMKSLVADNYALRDDLRAARAKLPADGSVVLSGDDARDWGQYRQFGKPGDLRKTIDEHKSLGERVATHERDETLRGVSEKAGVEFAVLKTLAGSTLVFGETKGKDKVGKEITIVTVKDGEAQPVPFDEYAAAKWGKFLPALKPPATTQQARQPSTPNRQEPSHRPQAATMKPMMPRPDGVVVPSFARADDKAPPDVLDRHRAIVKGAF